MSWLRRRVYPRLAAVTALLGLVVIVLWICGRVLTDTYLWSQYIWWIPALWMITGAWLLLMVSYGFDLISRRMGGVLMRPVLLLANIGCTGYLIFGVWHMHRAVLGSPSDPEAIRVMHWNMSGKTIDGQGWTRSVFDRRTDIVLLANPKWGDERQAILDGLAPFAPGERERWVNYSYKVHGDPSHFWIQGNAMIASRFPMVRSGMVRINTPTKPIPGNEQPNPGGGRGWIMFIEFDLSRPTDVYAIDDRSGSETEEQPTTPKEPLIVWFVDLPSDPSIFRQQMMQDAADAIEAWDGRGWRMGEHVWEQQTTDGKFPEPDLIIGDFNTPRGSDSIARLTPNSPNMTDAFEQSGFGRGRSWVPRVNNAIARQPIKLADWHIDLALVGGGWKTMRYRLDRSDEWGNLDHAMQTFEFIKRSD